MARQEEEVALNINDINKLHEECVKYIASLQVLKTLSDDYQKLIDKYANIIKFMTKQRNPEQRSLRAEIRQNLIDLERRKNKLQLETRKYAKSEEMEFVNNFLLYH